MLEFIRRQQPIDPLPWDAARQPLSQQITEPAKAAVCPEEAEMGSKKEAEAMGLAVMRERFRLAAKGFV